MVAICGLAHGQVVCANIVAICSHYLTTNEGLPENNILALLEDEGWFGLDGNVG